jgi:hypothetical protein
MFDDAFAHAECQVKATISGITLLEPGDDAEGMKVVVEAEAMLAEGGVEGLLPGVAKGGMANVVSEGEGLGEILVQTESRGDSAGDLGDFERVGEPAAEVVGWQVVWETGEDLSFAREASKGARVEDACAVASKRSAIEMKRLRMLTAGEFSDITDGDFRGQLKTWFIFFAHSELVLVWLYRSAAAKCTRTRTGAQVSTWNFE